MKIPMLKMSTKEIIKSKGMIAGMGLIALGGYMISSGQNEFGVGIIMNGLGIIGIRDAK